MTQREEKSVQYRGYKTVYWTTGPSSKEALVFVHGWTLNSELWPADIEVFRKYRCIMIDYLGHGKSEVPLEGYDFAPEWFSRSINEVCEAEGVAKVVLVGHSSGGPISTLFTRLYPTKSLGIVYVESALMAPMSEMNIEERQNLPAVFGGDKFADFMSTAFTDKTSPELRKKVLDICMSVPEYCRLGQVTTNSWPPAWKHGEKYDIPAIAICSEPSVAFSMTPDWKMRFPQLELEKWQGHSHYLALEDPQRFNDSIERFLQNNKLLSA